MSITICEDAIRPRIVPPLDPDFQPLVLENQAFANAVALSPHATPLTLLLERQDGKVSGYATQIFTPGMPGSMNNISYVERLLKSLLWLRGAWRVYVGGPREIGEALHEMYSPTGDRAFDAELMGEIYERDFTVVPCAPMDVPQGEIDEIPLVGNLDGCRIGFDLGASCRKVAALRDGEVVFSETMPWDPQSQHDTEYHYEKLQEALHAAAAHLPRVDAIGGSTAGSVIENRLRVSSLFRSVPDALFHDRGSDIFVRSQREWNVPFVVANDGDVAALAGAMSFGKHGVLGISLGSSEAGGYVTPHGALTGWLNELAFVPIDADPYAPEDEWSGDVGCGVQYLSQQAVARLLESVGLPIAHGLTMQECLRAVQQLAAEGDERVHPLYETLGVYLGYAVAHYADFYTLRHVLLLGGVTSGPGGTIILDTARAVLACEFPALAERFTLHLPQDAQRQTGQAIAAASLPTIAAG